jgi:signal transduction histidine kinase
MLQRLINDIIEASRISYGAFPIKPEETDFAMAFEDICITLAQRVQDPNVEFQKDSPFDHFPTTIDIGRIQQVLTNFITNAVKFTTLGHIRLGWKPKDNGLYLYCEDTGKGIQADKQALIFEQFLKLDEFVQGTGMGLAICKSIAERCGGKIGVNSDGEGKGSTFWLWVPCDK